MRRRQSSKPAAVQLLEHSSQTGLLQQKRTISGTQQLESDCDTSNPFQAITNLANADALRTTSETAKAER